MSPLGRVVRAGIGRRRVQTTVMTLTALIAVAASILAAGLLVVSDAPFDHAFAEQHGAELSAQFDGKKVTAAQLASTVHASGVTAATGPFPVVTVSPRTATGDPMLPADTPLPPMTVVGRASADGPVDDVAVISGHWATGPGQIVLSVGSFRLDLGSQMQFPDAPGDPTLTVVGTAQSVSQTADAWVAPTQVAELATVGTSPDYEMLYRFSRAGTDGQVSADRAAVAATVPSGAMAGAQSWLAIRQTQNANTAAFVPFVAAFGVIGLLLSALIIGIVVSGTVAAANRRIGILKALGFTPGQVARAYTAQALIPAVIGVAIGIVVGNLLGIPVFAHASRAYGTGPMSIPIWIDIAVPAAALAAVAVAAVVPARRAGLLPAAEAIAVGRTPRPGRGRLVQALAGRLPLARPLSLGLANPFARPARTATMGAAIALGTVTVTFAVGLTLSLNDVNAGRNLDNSGTVVVHAGGGGHGPKVVQAPGSGGGLLSSAVDEAVVAAAIARQPGTTSFYGTTGTPVSVSGITAPTFVIGYQGDSSWATHQMISGSWLTGPGQAVVSPRLLRAAGVKVGDALTLTSEGRSTRVRIVGDVFELSDDGMDVLTTTSTLTALGVDAAPGQFNVQLRPGTSVTSYLTSLDAAIQPTGAFAEPNQTDKSGVIAAMEALITLLTLLLVVAAGLGVLNTVVLDTRERVHDLGVLKAMGMTPRQMIATVLTSVAAIGLAAGIAGVPLGILVHHTVMPMMAHTVGESLPSADTAVYRTATLVLLALGGLVIAAAGALAPAGWAARSRTAAALHTE